MASVICKKMQCKKNLFKEICFLVAFSSTIRVLNEELSMLVQ